LEVIKNDGGLQNDTSAVTIAPSFISGMKNEEPKLMAESININRILSDTSFHQTNEVGKSMEHMNFQRQIHQTAHGFHHRSK